MSLKKCFDNAPKEIKDEFNKRVKDGMSEREIREIGTQILDKHLRDVFDEMEGVRNAVDPSYKKKEYTSPIKDVSDIDKIYDDRIKELDSMDEQIEEAKKQEEDREEKEDEEKETKPKEKKVPGQIYKGQKFLHSGNEWEVVEQVGDGWRIRSGNAATYVDDGTLKLVVSRGKIRRKEVAEKYKDELKKAFPGASEYAIKKIYAALKDKNITKKQWDQRVRDILAEDRGLGSAMDIAARYSVSALPENVRGVDSQSVIDKTKSVDAHGVKDMKEAAEFSVKQSIESMGRDGRVSFLDLRSDKDKANFPAGNMGQRLFMEDFDEVSPARVSAGSQLIDIIVAGNQRQKGMAAAYAIANRIISGESGFVTKLFGKVAKKIRITYNNQHKVVDQAGAVVAVFESANAAEQYVSRNLDQQYVIQYPNIISAIESDGGTIVLNAAKLGERMADFAGENRFFNWAEAAIYEELIHFATFKVATDAEIIKIGKELTKEQRKYVQQVYGGSTFVVKKDGKVYKYFRSEYDAEEYIKSRGEEGYEIDTISSLNDYQLGAEYVRMMVQHSITGTTTEMFKPNYTVRSVLAKLIQYLKNILKSSKDSLASKVISRIEEFIKGDQAAEKPSASRPKISMVAPDVYRVSVDDKQSFIQKRAGGIYQVVQTKEGVWEPVQDGQFNAGFLGHGHTDAIGKLTERMSRELGVSIGEIGAYQMQGVAELGLSRYGGSDSVFLNLSVAKKAKKDGVPKRAIKMATGWEFNELDGKWRYEILDTEVYQNADRSLLSIVKKEGEYYSARAFHLYELIPDWELYDAYPKMRFTRIYIVPKSSTNELLNGWVVEGGAISIVDNGNKNSMLHTLLHELQHVIQHEEGFARGGDPDTVLNKLTKDQVIDVVRKAIDIGYSTEEIDNAYHVIEETIIAEKQYNELSKSKKAKLDAKAREFGKSVLATPFILSNFKKAEKELIDELKSNGIIFSSFYNSQMPSVYYTKDETGIMKTLHDNFYPETERLFNSVRKRYRSSIAKVEEARDAIASAIANGSKNKIIKTAVQYIDNIAYYTYSILAGEVEARNADARSDIFADYQEMRESLLEETQDVAYDTQIKLMKGGKELAASQDFNLENPSPSMKLRQKFIDENMGAFSSRDEFELAFKEAHKGQPIDDELDFLEAASMKKKAAWADNPSFEPTQEIRNKAKENGLVITTVYNPETGGRNTVLGSEKDISELENNLEDPRITPEKYHQYVGEFLGYPQEAINYLLEKNAAGRELGASNGPWSSNKDANELFNELMGIQSEADRIWQESRGEYDPVEDFKYKYRDYILQDVMMTNVNRSESYEADVAAYERQQIDLAQAEFDMRNIMSEVFIENDVDEAFDYFIIKIMDNEQPMPLKNLIVRLLIEKFEGRPDIANFLREKIDAAFSTYSSLTLGSRIDQRTSEKGDPASRPNTTRKPPEQYKASWGKDVDSNIITKAVEGGDDIIAAKTALEAGMANNKFSRADYNAAVRKAEDAENRIKEIMEEVEAAKKYQSRKGVQVDKMVADAKAKESQRRFLSRYEERKSLVESIKYLADKINKISEKCSG